MKFCDLMSQCPALQKSFCIGLQAIKGSDRNLIYASRPRAILGSANIDAAMQEYEPHAYRWDYVIGMKEVKQCAYFVEVHNAVTSEVKRVLRKLQWLRGFIGLELPELRRGTFSSKYYWVGTNGVHIPRTTPQHRLLAQNGLKVVSRLAL